MSAPPMSNARISGPIHLGLTLTLRGIGGV